MSGQVDLSRRILDAQERSRRADELAAQHAASWHRPRPNSQRRAQPAVLVCILSPNEFPGLTPALTYMQQFPAAERGAPGASTLLRGGGAPAQPAGRYRESAMRRWQDPAGRGRQRVSGHALPDSSGDCRRCGRAAVVARRLRVPIARRSRTRALLGPPDDQQPASGPGASRDHGGTAGVLHRGVWRAQPPARPAPRARRGLSGRCSMPVLCRPLGPASGSRRPLTAPSTLHRATSCRTWLRAAGWSRAVGAARRAPTRPIARGAGRGSGARSPADGAWRGSREGMGRGGALGRRPGERVLERRRGQHQRRRRQRRR